MIAKLFLLTPGVKPESPVLAALSILIFTNVTSFIAATIFDSKAFYLGLITCGFFAGMWFLVRPILWTLYFMPVEQLPAPPKENYVGWEQAQIDRFSKQLYGCIFVMGACVLFTCIGLWQFLTEGMSFLSATLLVVGTVGTMALPQLLLRKKRKIDQQMNPPSKC